MVTRAGLVRDFFSVIVLAVRYDLVFDVLDEHIRIGITCFGLIGIGVKVAEGEK